MQWYCIYVCMYDKVLTGFSGFYRPSSFYLFQFQLNASLPVQCKRTFSVHFLIQVPCYSYGQKLSKLAILRIACNYILSLAQLADVDYSSEHSLSFSQCVEQCTRTLQAEGRSKKRKVRLISVKYAFSKSVLGPRYKKKQMNEAFLCFNSLV